MKIDKKMIVNICHMCIDSVAFDERGNEVLSYAYKQYHLYLLITKKNTNEVDVRY
jgi:hypothetical protein